MTDVQTIKPQVGSTIYVADDGYAREHPIRAFSTRERALQFIEGQDWQEGYEVHEVIVTDIDGGTIGYRRSDKILGCCKIDGFDDVTPDPIEATLTPET
jgi:hypothetical protein